MNVAHSPELQALTLRSSVLVLLRMLYQMVLDYCVLRSSENMIVFTKDQLVSLIERSSPDLSVGDIPKLVTQGLFKPAPVPGPENLQVLLVGDSGTEVSTLKEALAPREPNFPEWWEIPLPLALIAWNRLHFNRMALLMFGPDLKRIAVRDLNLPDRNEFLVELEGREPPCLFSFRRLEEDIFMLEDCTGDAAAAEEITWWAAVGKAWAEKLEREKRPFLRCEKPAPDEYETLPCEWEDRLLGYFCVGKPEQLPASKIKKKNIQEKRKNPKTQKRSAVPAKTITHRKNAAEDAALSVLGPQAMGLLAPGTNFTVAEEESPAALSPGKTPLRKTDPKEKKEKKAKNSA